MNKGLKITLIAIGAALILLQILKMTAILVWYKSPSSGNFPTLKTGETFLASRLASPKRFSFVCFKFKDSISGNHTRVYRLCGVEGDKVEIRDGILFINGENVDSGLPLAHNYFLSSEEAVKLRDLGALEATDLPPFPQDSVWAAVTDEAIKRNSISALRYIAPKGELNAYISKTFPSEWNQDQFGPVIVPKSKYFLLGDNRNGAQDSRYIGFIDKSSIVATVVGK